MVPAAPACARGRHTTFTCSRGVSIRRRRNVTPSPVTCAEKSDSSVIDKPSSAADVEKLNSLLKKKPPLYRVLLHNDNLNRREYVVQTLLRVVEGLTMDEAVNVMQEAHINGIAVVTIVSQQEAEQYVASLRKNGLTSTLEPSGGGSDSSCDN